MKENNIKNERSSIKEAIKTMEHWVEYEKNNKDKINKADELINIQETILLEYKKILKENEELKEIYRSEKKMKNEYIKLYQDLLLKENVIPVQKVKDLIDRIDYDIKKTKEIISNNSNIYTSDRKNDYQIVRLRAMNTKSLDIKKRLQELLERRK